MWTIACAAHLSLFLAVFFWLFFGALTYVNHDEYAGIIAVGAENMYVVSASYPS